MDEYKKSSNDHGGFDRTIAIPADTYGSLVRLTELDYEVSGALLYRPFERDSKGNLCIPECIYVLGIGDNLGSGVSSDSRCVKVLSRFLDENPEYNFIHFHTHPGYSFFQSRDNFTDLSIDDIEFYEENISLNPSFIGIMISPLGTTIYARDNPGLVKLLGQSKKDVDEKTYEEIESLSTDDWSAIDSGRFFLPSKLESIASTIAGVTEKEHDLHSIISKDLKEIEDRMFQKSNSNQVVDVMKNIRDDWNDLQKAVYDVIDYE